ncbi:baseplate J-like protein [Sporosarcina phage Lietuvens]|nr:baseplate J-like protein [Sporosarcina phage Lietuvens]
MAVFEAQTYEAILERLKSRLPDDMDKRPGSVIHDLLAPYAVELALAYIEMDNVLNFGFIDTSYGEYVDLRAGEQGLVRKDAVRASGTLTVEGEEGTAIPAGTVFTIEDSEEASFESLLDVTLGAVPAQVGVIAIDGGTEGNVAVGEIQYVLGDLSGVITAYNAEAFTGGLDEESDEELIKRYKDRVSRPSTSGNRFDYEQWAKEVVGVSEARCYPLWDGAGTVKVVLVNGEMRSPAQYVINDATAYIEERRPIGANVTVVGVTEVPVDVTVKLTLVSDADLAKTKADIAERITAHFRWFAFIQTILRYTQIGNAILESDGVIDYENLRINGVSSNIELKSDEVPVLGALTIEN